MKVVSFTGYRWIFAISLATVFGCNSETADRVVGPPHSDASYHQAVGSDAEIQAQKSAPPPAAIQGGEEEAPAIELVPADIAKKLEAQYQAGKNKSDDEADDELLDHAQEHVDFDALYEKIKSTSPPEREAFLMAYVAAAKHEDPDERDELLARLSSPELK